MNHLVRARGIVGRAFPKLLRTEGGIRVDVSSWHEDIARELARGLRVVELDAHRSAINSAANTAAENHGRSKAEVMDAILELLPLPRARRRPRGR